MRITLPALTALIALCACSSFSPRLVVPGTGGGELGPPDPSVGTTPDVPGIERTNARVRTACRMGARQEGWVAIEYVPEMRGCPHAPGDGGYNGAVIEYIGDRPIGSIVVICADQPPPRDWVREFADLEAACPGARVDEGDPGALRIRRIR